MLTEDMIEMAGNRFMPDGSGGGTYVRELSAWKYPGFRIMVCEFLGMERQEAESIIKRNAEGEQRRIVADRQELIPDMYRVAPIAGYAVKQWESAREYVRVCRNEAMKGRSLPWLYITAQSGRGKSHMAGQVASALSHHVPIAWINCEDLDAALRSAAGGDKVAESFAKDRLDEAARSALTVLDDFGKPDTISDGVSLPYRIQPLHGMLEAARTAMPRRAVIVTSEYSPEQLERRVSAGVVNRIMELSSHVVIDEAMKFIDWSRK